MNMDLLMEWLGTKVMGDTVFVWLVALLILLASFLLLNVLKNLLVSRLARLAARTPTDVDDFLVDELDRTRGYFIFALALYLASLVLDIRVGLRDLVRLFLVISLLFQAAVWGNELIDFLLNRRLRGKMESDPSARTTLNAFSMLAKIVLWVVILLLVLDNLPGVEVSSLEAILGITGVAVALAVQNILGDLFASLSIAIDKPFVIGDFIIVGDFVGSVEHIGLKSTRVRSVSGEQLVFSNSDLLNSRIRNIKRMERRRVVFPVQVSYQTPVEKLAKIPQAIRDIIAGLDSVTFDRAHFHRFGASSYDIEVVYFVENPDYTFYMDKQQAINLALIRYFEDQKLEFAAPTQTVVVTGALAGVDGLATRTDAPVELGDGPSSSLH